MDKGDKNELFRQIEKHLLEDEKPSIYIKTLLKERSFNEYPFSFISDLQDVDQNPKYHPEGNVFNHTMMVIDEGAKVRDKSNDKRVLMWSLFLHDVGKKSTTKMRKGRLTSYNHDTVGKKLAQEFLNYFDQSKEDIMKVSSLVRWHMQSLFVSKNSRFKNISDMIKDVDKNEIVLVALADRMGRGKITEDDVKQTLDDIEKFRLALNEE